MAGGWHHFGTARRCRHIPADITDSALYDIGGILLCKGQPSAGTEAARPPSLSPAYHCMARAWCDQPPGEMGGNRRIYIQRRTGPLAGAYALCADTASRRRDLSQLAVDTA